MNTPPIGHLAAVVGALVLSTCTGRSSHSGSERSPARGVESCADRDLQCVGNDGIGMRCHSLPAGYVEAQARYTMRNSGLPPRPGGLDFPRDGGLTGEPLCN